MGEYKQESYQESYQELPQFVSSALEQHRENLSKLFIGGLNKSVSDDEIREMFSQYGHVTDCVAIKDRNEPGTNKGFGFVTFESLDAVNAVMEQVHHGEGISLKGKKCDIKRAIPKDNPDPVNHTRTNKCFVGGISQNMNEDDLREYLMSFPGVGIKKLDFKGKFAFVEFDSEDNADVMAIINKHSYAKQGNRPFEIKKSAPKEGDFRGGRGGGFSRGGGRGAPRGGPGGYGGGPGSYGGGGGGGGYSSGGYGGPRGSYGGGPDQGYQYDNFGGSSGYSSGGGSYGGSYGGAQQPSMGYNGSSASSGPTGYGAPPSYGADSGIGGGSYGAPRDSYGGGGGSSGGYAQGYGGQPSVGSYGGGYQSYGQEPSGFGPSRGGRGGGGMGGGRGGRTRPY